MHAIFQIQEGHTNYVRNKLHLKTLWDVEKEDMEKINQKTDATVSNEGRDATRPNTDLGVSGHDSM